MAAHAAGPVGQLWAANGGDFQNPDGKSNFRVERINSDAGGKTIVTSAATAGGYYAMCLDTAAGVFVVLDVSANMTVRSMASGNPLHAAFVAYSTLDQDVMNSIVVDPRTQTIYADLFGGDYLDVDSGHTRAHGGDLIKMTYDPVTGVVTSPYDAALSGGYGGITPGKLSGILIDSDTTNHVYADARSINLSRDGGTLYYVDDNDNDPGAYWGFGTNGIFKVSTSGNVTSSPPTPVMLSNQAQFPINDSNGYITGLAVDEDKGILYFTTNDGEPPALGGTHPGQNAVWWMPIAGGTATKMSMPAGVTLIYPEFFGNALAFDPVARQLYLTDKGDGTNTGKAHIAQLTLSADGHSFSSGVNDFAQFDTNASNDGYDTNTMVFDSLPVPAALNGTSTHATEQVARIPLLNANPTLQDLDNTFLAGASISISGSFVGSGDELSLNNGGSPLTVGTFPGTSINVSTSSSSGNETLLLVGKDTLAHYQSALGAAQFFANGDNPTNYGNNPGRTLTWVISDGAPGIPVPARNSTTTSITIDAVNDPPSVGAGATTSYTEQQSTPPAISPALTTADPDNLNLASATVAITGGFLAGDTLTFNATGTGITGTYHSDTGMLNLSGSDTLANYRIVLRSVAFSSPSDNPTNYGADTSRTITYVVNDGLLNSTAAASTVNVSAVDDPPHVATASGNATYTENMPAVAVNAGIAVTDADDLDLTAATVSISAGYLSGDMLGFVNQNGISGSYNAATGVLSLSGTATVAQYQTALASVTFSSTSDNPTDYDQDGTRTISFTAHDNSFDSAAATTTVIVSDVDDAPVNQAPASYTAQENIDSPLNGLSVSDIDANPASDAMTATLTVTNGILTIASAGGATVANSGTATVILTGSTNQINTTLAAADNVLYRSNAGYLGAASLTFITNDAGHSGSGGPLQAQVVVPITVTLPDDIFKDGFNGD